MLEFIPMKIGAGMTPFDVINVAMYKITEGHKKATKSLDKLG